MSSTTTLRSSLALRRRIAGSCCRGHLASAGSAGLSHALKKSYCGVESAAFSLELLNDLRCVQSRSPKRKAIVTAGIISEIARAHLHL
jgi:hypothetical protein